MIGKRLGDFVIKEAIGKGGMGTVYKAEQISLNRDVAIKILLHDLSCNEEFVERFDIEAKHVASLIHQNIIQMYTKGITGEGIHYFAMEYVDGEDLSSKIKRGVRFSEKEVIDIIIQACQGLESAWRQNIIHRDIKPSNIIITRDGVLKIADFGLAKSLESTMKLTQTNVYMGSVHYTSPEQGEGKSLDHRTDIYSLGVVLYQLLTSKIPFESKTPLAVIYKHVYEPPVPPREIKPQLSFQIEAVVLKAIAKRPDERYQNVVEFREALETVKQTFSDKMTKSVVAPAELARESQETLLYRGSNERYMSRIWKKNTVIIAVLFILLIGGVALYMLFIRGNSSHLKTVNTIEELTAVIVDGLVHNLKESPLNVTIGKMTIENTNYSSNFAGKILESIENELKMPKYGSYFKEVKKTNITKRELELTQGDYSFRAKGIINAVLEGHYWINNDEIFINLQLMDQKNNKISKVVSSKIRRSAIKWKLKPDNFDIITETEKEIASVPQRKNDFRVDIWIDKGNGGIYKEGDNIEVLFKTEVDCYIKVLYIDADGNRILMFPTEMDPKTKLAKGEINELHANKEYNVIPPFGTEIIMAFLSTEAFSDTGEVSIGMGYKGFSSNIKTSEIITKLRGLQVGSVNADTVPKRAEESVYLTTIKG